MAAAAAAAASGPSVEVLDDKPSKPKDKKKPECTIGMLYDAFEALDAISNDKFDPKGSQRILKLADWVRPYYEDVVEKRKELATRLGEPLESEPGRFRIPPEKIAEFNRTMAESLVEPVKVPERIKLTVDDFFGSKISPANMLKLRCVISDLYT